MTIEINLFWKLLSNSQLLPEQKIHSLRNQFSSVQQDRSANGLAKWLIDQKAISNYQATILLAGHHGPFQYGNYTLVDRFNKGHLGRTFRAVHSRTLYPVMLEFFAGTGPDDLKNWQQAESIAEKVSQIEHPNLLSIYESVALDDHRFIVGQLPLGVPLLQTLTPKGRLPWKTACLLTAQVARGLRQFHLSEIVHGSISPNCIWLQKNGFAQLRLSLPSHTNFEAPADPKPNADFDYRPPESNADTPPSTAGDIFALGCTLYRAIAGRAPWDSKTRNEGKGNEQRPLAGDALITSLAKLELPKELGSLIQQMLTADPTQRPHELHQLSDQLAQFSGSKKLIDSFSAAKTHSMAASMAAYRQSLNQFKPGSEQLVEQVPVIETEFISPNAQVIPSDDALMNLAADRAEKINAAAAAAQRRRKNRWRLPAAVAGTLMLFAGAIGVWAFNADRKIVQSPKIPAIIANTTPEEDVSVPAVPTTPILDLAAMPPSKRPILLQDLVAEDSESLWESPTTGAPIDFSGVPLAPKLIFVFRPAEIVSQPEGVRTLQSLGPEFNSLVKRWETQSGMELAEVSQLIVSLHTTTDFDYEPFFVVTTSQAREVDELLQLWNRPPQTTAENGQPYFAAANSELAYYVFPAGNTDESLAGSDAIPAPISRFAFGNRTAIEEVANNPKANRLAGSLRKTSNWADHDRHLNLLFLRNALFNDEGQQLMGPRLQTVNRELAIMIPESVRGGLFSLHLDGGTFLELMFDRNVDIQPEDLITLLTGQLRIGREQLTQFVARIPPSPYWDKVRQKYDNMLADLFRNFRWNVEHGEVAANCWLPPMAAHNLIAASELVISFSKGDAGTTQPAVASGPQTIEELLAIERDLVIANPPDLNVLMADIESEVNDDYRDLPFRFRIRLLGSDLEQKGITKNQRPGELKIRQTPLADILTEIMVGANPAKDISGSADPNCQLIWVIAEDPESAGEKAILITTRAAATEKSYKLPPEFETK